MRGVQMDRSVGESQSVAASVLLVTIAGVGTVIEAPWLVNGGHGASLRHHTCTCPPTLTDTACPCCHSPARPLRLSTSLLFRDQNTRPIGKISAKTGRQTADPKFWTITDVA
jgi:hypothetical protein